MGVELADRRTGPLEAAGGPALRAHDESARESLGLQVTEDRVLIRADQEDLAPTQTASGVYTAKTLAAAVDGSDSGESWFTGTVVQLGPLVNRFDPRKAVLRWVRDLEAEGTDVALMEIRHLRRRVEELPTESPEPVCVGNRVCFSWASGQQITVDGDTYVIVRASEILAVLEE